jgi:hypothetical protein
VLEVRYEAGQFGSGYKDRPKSATSIRVIPLAGQVAEAVGRQLPAGSPPDVLVFTGPGGGSGVAVGTRTALSRDNLRRVYHAALARAVDLTTRLANTPRRVLQALRQAGPGQTPETLRACIPGVTPTAHTVHAALCELRAAGLATLGPGRRRRRRVKLVGLYATHGRHLRQPRVARPHDLRHTFSTWLEDAGIPARVIDELMGHADGRRGAADGSPIGVRYRHTTPEMEARAVAAIEQRLTVALKAVGERLQSGRLEVTEVGTGSAESAGHCCILGSCVGSAYMGGQPRSIASGRSS